MSKFILFKSVNDMPEVPVSQASMGWNKTGSWRSSTPTHKNIMPPCNFNCPAGEDIRGYIDLLKKNRTEDAFNLLMETNPFPAVCGQVCYHPCQANCNRHKFDTELQIRSLEKIIGDWGVENKKHPNLPKASSKKIAIIGAGPAGLTAAYYLRKRGLSVAIYDENHLPGGILQYGIPAYRLEKDVLKAEINRILQGVEFQANMKFGSDFDFSHLAKFDGIFVATGAHQSKRMKITGEDQSGVESGLDFLKNVNSGNAVRLKDKKVVVIGGGNTACDVARTAYRLGAKVQMIYRRTEKELPAFAEEVEQLKAEPIELEFLAAPEKIEKDSEGKLKITFCRMKLGEPDESGRARPIPVEGKNYEVKADVVYTAIGEDPDLSCLPGVQTDGDGDFSFSKVNKHFRHKLFLGGDILPNPRTVPHAVASGRLAAEKILAFLDGKNFEQPENIIRIAGPEDINYRYFTRINEVKQISALKKSSSKIEQTIVVEEANRCFSCGVCTECDNCYNFCPDLAVIRTSTGYQVNLDYCKGCGICAVECPCGSLKMGAG